MRGAEANKAKIVHGCLEKHATIPRILTFGEVLETSCCLNLGSMLNIYWLTFAKDF